MENKKNEDCIFCFSLLFSSLKIEFKDIPIIISNCYINHQKQILLSQFLEYNNKSFDNIKLKVECPLCQEFLDKDNFFICIENNKLICPKCIALNIIISSSNKNKKPKTIKNNKKIKNEPHYATLISLLKESALEKKIEINFDEKKVDKEKDELVQKFKKYKEIIMEEKNYKKLNKIYNFLYDLNDIKKKFCFVYKENKGYLSKRFYENLETIISLDILYEIFLNNFSLNEKDLSLINSKELRNDIQSLFEHYKNRTDKSILINKLLLNKDKNEINCIYQQDSIISYILKFRYETISGEIENYLIISSNNGIIIILNFNDHKPVYNIDIFQSKGVYHLIQCKNEKNVFYASSWGCFKKIKLTKEDIKEKGIQTFIHTVIKTFKKSDIIRILKLIELPKNYFKKNNSTDIISLDEGGHIIVWGYNQEIKKDLKEEIFVSEREDSINNIILFESKKIQNKLIFTTRNSTLLGSIHFYNIDDGIYEAKCMKNSYRKKSIYFDLQYNTLKQINDLMIIFPQNKRMVLINVKYYEIVTIIELQTELEKEKFYNNYGETIDIINYENSNNNYIFIISSKRYIFEYLFEENDLIYLGKTKLDEIKEDIEFALNPGNTNNCIYIKLNKKLLLINI